MSKNNLNTKILKAIQKGLNEVLSNYDLTVIDDEDSVLVKNDAYKRSSIYGDIIDKIYRNISDFLKDDKMFKNIVEKMILANRQYTVKTKKELILLINKSIKIFGDECDLNWIDTSQITDMSRLFYEMEDFNGHIEKWNVSNVKDMRFMFCGAESFNQPIGNWDVSCVEDMAEMFCGAKSFNQQIGDWDVSNVKNMTTMFYNATSFNQPISKWDVSNVKDMSWMFAYAESFNQPLNNWDVSNVKDMRRMFNKNDAFNLNNISNWNINNIKLLY